MMKTIIFRYQKELESDKEFILIIYDIVENKKRVKFAKLLSGYGIRVQKSAFEAMLTKQQYNVPIDRTEYFRNRIRSCGSNPAVGSSNNKIVGELSRV